MELMVYPGILAFLVPKGVFNLENHSLSQFSLSNTSYSKTRIVYWSILSIKRTSDEPIISQSSPIRYLPFSLESSHRQRIVSKQNTI